jgi:hypothetical protein
MLVSVSRNTPTTWLKSQYVVNIYGLGSPSQKQMLFRSISIVQIEIYFCYMFQSSWDHHHHQSHEDWNM